MTKSNPNDNSVAGFQVEPDNNNVNEVDKSKSANIDSETVEVKDEKKGRQESSSSDEEDKKNGGDGTGKVVNDSDIDPEKQEYVNSTPATPAVVDNSNTSESTNHDDNGDGKKKKSFFERFFGGGGGGGGKKKEQQVDGGKDSEKKDKGDDGEEDGDGEENRIPKWSFGVLNDPYTEEVPGSVLLFAGNKTFQQPLGLSHTSLHSALPSGSINSSASSLHHQQNRSSISVAGSARNPATTTTTTQDQAHTATNHQVPTSLPPGAETAQPPENAQGTVEGSTLHHDPHLPPPLGSGEAARRIWKHHGNQFENDLSVQSGASVSWAPPPRPSTTVARSTTAAGTSDEDGSGMGLKKKKFGDKKRGGEKQDGDGKENDKQDEDENKNEGEEEEGEKKMTSDGQIILDPQPSDSPNDPLNWLSIRRDSALLSLGFYSMLGGGMTPILAAAFPAVASAFSVSTPQVALTTGFYMLGLGMGSVFASPTAILWGKRPVYLVGVLVMIGSSVWCALAPSYGMLVVGRVIMGFGVSPCESLPSATIAEIFFLHERAYRVGIYTLLLLGGKNLIPLVSAAIVTGLGWRWIFWIVTIAAGLSFVLLFLFVPETFWDRTPRKPKKSTRGAGSLRSRMSSFLSLHHTTGHRSRSRISKSQPGTNQNTIEHGMDVSGFGGPHSALSTVQHGQSTFPHAGGAAAGVGTPGIMTAGQQPHFPLPEVQQTVQSMRSPQATVHFMEDSGDNKTGGESTRKSEKQRKKQGTALSSLFVPPEERGDDDDEESEEDSDDDDDGEEGKGKDKEVKAEDEKSEKKKNEDGTEFSSKEIQDAFSTKSVPKPTLSRKDAPSGIALPSGDATLLSSAEGGAAAGGGGSHLPPLTPGLRHHARDPNSPFGLGAASDAGSMHTSFSQLPAQQRYTRQLQRQPPKTFVQNLRPINGRIREDKWLKAMCRPFVLFAYPAIVWGALVYSFSIGWLIVLSETVSSIYQEDPYDFKPIQTGLVYISPFIGGILGTAVAGKASDVIVRWMARKNGGLYEPEFRLVMAIPVALSTSIGLMGFGWAAQNHDSWIVPTIFFGTISFGCSLGSTTSITFVVDSYRQYAGEGLVTLNWSKNVLHGFVFSLFFNKWLDAKGPKQVFLVIGGLQVGCLLIFTPFLFVFGKRARMWTVRKNLMAPFLPPPTAN